MSLTEKTSLLDLIVHEASQLPAAERDDFLRRRCGDDAELLAEAQSLAGLDSRLIDHLDRPLFQLHGMTAASSALTPGVADPSDDEEPIDDPAPRRLGPYTIERKLGSGGLSTVYLARQSDGRDPRPVALKVLKTGLATVDIERRFVREGEILAGLRHPGIAQIFGGGTTEDGRSYLVMEWIQGRTLGSFIAQEKPPLRRRLELFIELCESVAYAHGRLVVHRDLKPDNVLVDDNGRPRLLDFGISKLLDPDTAEPVTQTHGFGLMTPQYAAPEQVRRLPVTIATDIYSLGVVLHEMLAGERPYRASLKDPDWWKVVCEDIPEPVSKTASRHADTGIAVPASRLRGDLDAVVQRCLRKEPQDRYPNVDRLIDDLRRHLDSRPVRARQGERLYRARKFVVRHRLGLAFLTLLALISSAFMVDRERQHRRQVAESERTRALSDFLIYIFENASPSAPVRSEITLQEVVDLGARRLDYLQATPAVQLELMGTIGSIYTTLGSLDDAEPLLRRSRSLAEQLYGGAAESTALSRAHMRSGLLARGRERFAEAAELFERAAAVAGSDRKSKALALAQLGLVQRDLGDLDAARSRLEEAYEGLESLVPDTAAQDDWTAALHRIDKNLVAVNWAFVLRQQGRNDEAEPLLRRSLLELESDTGPDHFVLAQGYNNLALMLYQKGDFEGTEQALKKSLETCEKVLGSDHPQTLTSAGSLAGLYSAQGRLEEAEIILADLVGRWRRISGADTLGAHLLHNYTNALKHLGRRQEAEGPLLEALGLRRKIFGPEHFDTARLMAEHGFLLLDLDREAEGERLTKKAYDLAVAALGPDHPEVSLTGRQLATIQQRLGRCAEAVEILRPMLELRAVPQAEFIHRRIVLSRCLLGSEPGEALRLMDEVQARKELLEGAPSLSQEYLDALHMKARHVAGTTSAAEARPVLDKALEVLEAGSPRTRSWLIDDVRRWRLGLDDPEPQLD